ncbi:MAG: quinolinate synthase NadA [Pseudomonadota bacterium]
MGFLPREGAFPALKVSAHRLEPRGPYAEAQAAWLLPDERAVRRLTALLEATRTGVAAHFYMDAELQGVLCASPWPHTFVSDSLAMADRAIAMIQGGVERIVVLGVDFMSENVRAVLDAQGYAHVPVHRVATEPIGCTLAEAAASPAYDAWLEAAARTPQALHVIYINTGLDVKARAEARVPTITCTSSNALRTVAQAIVQIPGVALRFGPDTHMGRNLRVSLERLAAADPAECVRLHPDLTPAAVAAALERYEAFPEGACAVHQVFGAEVVRVVREHYGHALVAAHLEVPGEMFDLALAAQAEGRGTVGSTSDILAFILARLDAAIAAGERELAPVILGTEAGMITSIVRAVQARLREARSGLAVEILFPVAAGAVTATGSAELPIVPGVAASEGCAVDGGCATCPYMKMSSLGALEGFLERVREGASAEDLRGFEPRRYSETLQGRPLAEWGTQPILAMRHLQRSGRLSAELVGRVRG